MINFWLGPYSNQELSIAFEIDDALKFAENLKEIQNFNQIKSIEAVRKYKNNSTTGWMHLALSPNENEFLSFKKNDIELNFTEEAIDYALYKIEKFVKEGDFSPPEYYSFDLEKSSKKINIFFVKNN